MLLLFKPKRTPLILCIEVLLWQTSYDNPCCYLLLMYSLYISYYQYLRYISSWFSKTDASKLGLFFSRGINCKVWMMNNISLWFESYKVRLFKDFSQFVNFQRLSKTWKNVLRFQRISRTVQPCIIYSNNCYIIFYRGILNITESVLFSFCW